MYHNRPKLLVILGAGSSIPCGMPCVPKIGNLMSRWSREWVPEPSIDAEGNVFNLLWEASKRYYGTNHYNIRPNYERVLGEMTALASWLSPRPFGNPIVEVLNDGALVSPLESLRGHSDEYAGSQFVLTQQTFLLEKLAHHMRNLSKALNFRLPAFSDYLKFFGELRDRFELGIYNLNYDAVARTAWPEAYCGFDSHGSFDPSSVNQRQEWGFIYHLHGSVHHSIREYPRRIEWQEDLGSKFKDRLDGAPDMAQDFRSVPLTTFISGGFKLDQLLVDPYQTFYSALVKHAQEADAFLIVGYGFGDLHVNKALRNRCERRDDKASAPQVVVLEKSPDGKLQTASLQSHDFWAYQLTHTLDTRFRITEAHLKRELTVASVVENGKFETDQTSRVAIWHGGFLEALPAVTKITDWLSRRL